MAQNADLHRKLLIFSDAPLLLKIQTFGGKTQIFAGKRTFRKDCSKLQIGIRNLGSVPFLRTSI